ncbi:MAG: YfhO family protein [bacterium]
MAFGSNKREIALLLLVLAILIGFFWDVLFEGRVLLTCNPSLWYPWRQYATNADLELKTYRTDSALTYLPRMVELHRSLRSTKLPLWNPYIFMGYPFWADPQSRALYPVSLFLGLIDPQRAMAIDIVVHFFIAILGMYLFLKSVTSDQMGPFFGGLLFGFSGFMATRMGHPTFVSTAAWIPWVFYLYRLVEESKRYSLFILTICFAICYLAGFPQITLFAVGALVLYSIWMGLEDLIQNKQIGSLRNGLLGIFVAGGIALLLVSPTLFPFIEFLRNSKGLGIELGEMVGGYVSNPWLLARAGFPHFFGNPVEGTSWLRIFSTRLHPYNTLFIVYVGIGGLFLAIGSIAYLRSSREIRFFWFLLLLTVGIGVSPGVLKIFYDFIPILRMSQIDRICVLANFSMAALSGISLSQVSSLHRRENKIFLVSVISLAALFLISLLTLGFDAKGVYKSIFERMKMLPAETWHHPASYRVAEWIADEKGFSEATMKIARNWALVVLTSTTLLVLTFVLGSKKRRIILPIFVGFSVFELLCFARSYYVSQPKGLEPTEGTEILSYLTSSSAGWRVESYKAEMGALPPNTNQIFGLPSIRGLSTITPKAFEELLWALTGLSINSKEPMVNRRLSEIGCGRFLISSDLDTSLAISPYIKHAKSKGASLHTVTLGGNPVIAVETPMNNSTDFEATLPDAEKIEIYFGFDNLELFDSVHVAIELQKQANGDQPSVWFDRRYGIEEAGKWHRISLDISALGNGRTLLRTTSSGRGSDSARCYWGGFEVIRSSCDIKKVGEAYEITGTAVNRIGGVLKIEVLGSGLLTLEIFKPERIVRFVDFTVRPYSQSILVEIENPIDRVIVKGDEQFEIKDARLVHLEGSQCVEFCPIYIGDLVIIENMAALPRGLVLSEGYLEVDPKRKRAIFLGESICDAISGGSKRQIYTSTEMISEVKADQQGYFLFQDVYYPGWKALVDGKSQQIYNFNGLRCIKVEKGTHRIVIRYRPVSLFIGCLLCLSGILLCVVEIRKEKGKHDSRRIRQNRS